MKFIAKIVLFSALIGLFIFLFGYLVAINSSGYGFLIIAVGCLIFLAFQVIFIHFLIGGLTKTVAKLKQINIYKESVTFSDGRFKELDALHQELNEFAVVNREHYLSQKNYSENLSHELLTPLAIIRTKAELLLQAPDLREVDLLHLDSIIQTVGRLSNLNRGLILLSKIDNGQFVDSIDLILQDLVSESLENMEDQIRKKQLEVKVDFLTPLPLHSNLNLMRILVANLIKNAVFHNVEGGYIFIRLTECVLYIENSGLPNDQDPNLFFQRFVTDKNTEHSIGLGLSIAQQICNLLGYSISYKSNGSVHILEVDFQ